VAFRLKIGAKLRHSKETTWAIAHLINENILPEVPSTAQLTG
jgi:hypothetical protein